MQDWPSGYGRRVLEEVDSTNSEAARIASEVAHAEWILAYRQTAARGRRGRAWIATEGNFFATLLLRPLQAPDLIAQRSFVAALALYDALVMVTGRAECFSLKWPNDVLLNGGKVAGILLESVGVAGGSVGHIAIGIGVNLGTAPEGSDVEPRALRPVSLLSETGAQVRPEEFLDVLAPLFADWESQLVSYGFAPIRNAWIARAARLGEVISARTVREEWVGTFETVDNAGNLVLKTSKGPVVIPAADVFF